MALMMTQQLTALTGTGESLGRHQTDWLAAWTMAISQAGKNDAGDFIM
jgi:hypothetical protein